MDSVLRIGSLLAEGAEHAAEGSGGGHHEVSFVGVMAYLGLVLVILFLFMYLAKQGFNRRVFRGRWAQYAEQLFLFLENMCVGIIGPHGRKYIPLIMTFWMVIFVSNIVALFMPSAPTAVLSFNLAMAIIAVFYVQGEGIRANGLIGHLSHFKGPKLGGIMVLVSFLIFPIEIVSELMKNVSLSLRLFGNIEGGHQAVLKMSEALGHWNIGGVELHVPVGAFLMPVKLMTCVVQALIFTLLTCVYLSLVTHHAEDHGHEHAHGEPAAAH